MQTATDDGIVVARGVSGRVDVADITMEGLGRKIDDMGARIDTRIDAVDAKVDSVAADLGSRIGEVASRLDAHARSHDEQFAAVQFTFGEMRTFTTELFGGLRNEMLARFERVDRRFDRIELKLDRALAPRLPSSRRRRDK